MNEYTDHAAYKVALVISLLPIAAAVIWWAYDKIKYWPLRAKRYPRRGGA